jgi:hypothetical protein
MSGSAQRIGGSRAKWRARVGAIDQVALDAPCMDVVNECCEPNDIGPGKFATVGERVEVFDEPFGSIPNGRRDRCAGVLIDEFPTDDHGRCGAQRSGGTGPSGRIGGVVARPDQPR